MPRLDERDYTYLTTVRGMCRKCRAIVPARVFARDGQVWQQSLCPTCENGVALICGDATWYLEQILRPMPDRGPLPHAHPPERGCPHDCGPCTWHASPCQLPVISITNACNLDCPICFTYNRADKRYFMSEEEMQATIDWIVAATGSVDLINITGGEPTTHPGLLALLARCKRPEIGRITMNSNGIRLASDFDLCKRLAEMGVYVALSFNTVDRGVSETLHGRDVVEEKLQAIENLTAAGVSMTLLCVLVRDTNEEVVGRILDLMRDNDRILNLTVQTMTYTGQGGGSFPNPAHIPADEAARIVARHSQGVIEPSDFIVRPSAHPLCYQVSYLLRMNGRLTPFSRFCSEARLRDLLRDSYLPHVEDRQSTFREIIDELYAAGETDLLRDFRALLKRIYPNDERLTAFERQRRAEECVRAIYVHAHMDEDTFDCSRAMHCPDLVPASPGRLVPACTYNLFYRMQDERFWVPPTEGYQ